jgi:hypothetical protein
MEVAVLFVPVPGAITILPRAIFTTVRITSAFSSVVRTGDSPVVATGQIPSVPERR